MLVAFFVLCFSFPSIDSVGAGIADCKVSASKQYLVSLGFPVAAERLNVKPKPRILVIRVKFIDSNVTYSQEKILQDYNEASKIISELSNGKSEVSFTISDVIPIESTIKQQQIFSENIGKDTRNLAEDKNFDPWVRKTLIELETKFEYSKYDAVLLEGNFDNIRYQLGVAMPMLRAAQVNEWKPIETKSGLILNAIYFNYHRNPSLIAHEIMHLNGLTDLYGVTQDGVNHSVGDISMMSGFSTKLLAFEKWVIGWIQDQDVKCLIEEKDLSINNVENHIQFPYLNKNSFVVIRTGKSTADVIEIVNSVGKEKVLYYGLNNELRPPITTYSGKSNLFAFDLTNGSDVGKYVLGDHFYLLFKSIADGNLEFQLIPKSLIKTVESINAISKAIDNKPNSKIELARLQKYVAPKPIQVQVSPTPMKQSIIKITCYKGKLIKYVTGVTPKCPTGYKKT